MTDKKKSTDKNSTKKMSEEETSKVVGGMMPRPGTAGPVGGNSFSSDSCKETTDTGMMGCSG